MLNRVQLMGYLGHDPELQTDKQGKKYTVFCLLVPRNVRGFKGKVYDFLRVKAWKATAENVCKFFSKGNVMIVDGTLRCPRDKDRPSRETYVNAEYVFYPVEGKFGKTAMDILSKVSFEGLIEHTDDFPAGEGESIE